MPAVRWSRRRRPTSSQPTSRWARSPTASSPSSPSCSARYAERPATSEPTSDGAVGGCRHARPVTDADAVRRVGLDLPRAYEVEVRGRSKLRVRQIVFVAFSRDERQMGFGFPRAERDGLVASDPDTFFLPAAADLRYQWVCAHLDRLADDEMRELVVDAWRMCTPKMLHELPDLPAPTARAWDL